MKKILVFFLIFSTAILLYGFDLLIIGGYSYATPTGWYLGVGGVEEPFEGSIYVTFYISEETTLYEFNIFSYVPLISVEPFSMGPSINILKGNFYGGRELVAIGGGFRFVTTYFSLTGTIFYPLYPDGEEFNVSKDIFIRLRYFLQPPRGLHFKDRLFFSITYSSGFFRVGLGLLEPIP